MKAFLVLTILAFSACTSTTSYAPPPQRGYDQYPQEVPAPVPVEQPRYEGPSRSQRAIYGVTQPQQVPVPVYRQPAPVERYERTIVPPKPAYTGQSTATRVTKQAPPSVYVAPPPPPKPVYGGASTASRVVRTPTAAPAPAPSRPAYGSAATGSSTRVRKP